MVQNGIMTVINGKNGLNGQFYVKLQRILSQKILVNFGASGSIRSENVQNDPNQYFENRTQFVRTELARYESGMNSYRLISLDINLEIEVN